MNGGRKQARYHYLVPVFGFVFDAACRSGDVASECSGMFLRPAMSEEDARQSLACELVSQDLRRHVETQAKPVPFEQCYESVTMEDLEKAWFRLPRPAIQFKPRFANQGEDPTLFLKFAAVEPTAFGISEFANTYGNLSFACWVWSWHEEVLAMRRALSVWEMLKGNKIARLKAHFKTRESQFEVVKEDGALFVSGDCQIQFDSHPHLPPNAQPLFPDQRVLEGVLGERKMVKKAVNDSDVSLAAKLYLIRVVNDHIAKHTRSVLEWSGKRMSRLALAKNLLGTLWLQFERSIAGMREYRRCLTCGDYMEISHTVTRSDKEYCSDACRAKAYRNRKGSGAHASDQPDCRKEGNRTQGKRKRK
jgi:hypothetical protein